MDRLIEELAKYAHSAWSGWMIYLFSKSSQNADGGVVIPSELVTRWKRQMGTAYRDLPEKEKESDREEARKILNAINRVLSLRLKGSR